MSIISVFDYSEKQFRSKHPTYVILGVEQCGLQHFVHFVEREDVGIFLRDQFLERENTLNQLNQYVD